VLLGFVDEEVAGLVGIGEPEEYPLALVTVEAPAVSEPAGSPPPGPLSARTWPLSRSPRRYPLVTAAQRAGELPSAAAVTAWRNQVGRLPAQPAAPLSRSASNAGQARAAADTVEAVILRRGSTRRFARHPLPRGGLCWAMAAATRAVPGDVAPPQATHLEHFLAVHAVDGLTPGAYRCSEGDFQLLRAGAERRRTHALCLGQDLGGDSAATVFHCARLEPILQALGARGYRAAQLEGGVAAERLQLAAFTLGFGATGVTFLDDDVSAFFDTQAAPMLAVAVGVPSYRARPGKRPAQLPRVGLAER
jgi:nitroreductase